MNSYLSQKRSYRKAIKEDFEERTAPVLAEAAEIGESVRYARQNFGNRRTAFRNLIGTTNASRRGMEKNHPQLLLISLRQPRPLASSPSERKWASHHRRPLLRSVSCHHVGEKSKLIRYRHQTTEQPPASPYHHGTKTTHPLSVGMQSS